MRSDEEDYMRLLEQTIRKFLQPIDGVPFPLVVKALTGYRVLIFDSSIEENKRLLERLAKAAQLGGQKAFEKGIISERANEAGNKIEDFILDALKQVGLKAEKPVTRSGKRKNMGYPDIEITDENNTILYLECKTYSLAQKEQTFRTFYLSPSEDPKVTKDAFHLLMSFEIKRNERNGGRIFVPVTWQIYTLDKLLVQVKHEFNASNKDLYKAEALLAEGKIV